MKRKLTAIIVAAIMLAAMIPGQVSAAGTGDGSSIDNARPVTTSAELTIALADPVALFIETSGFFSLLDSVVIPSGKTVIVQPVADRDPVLNMNGHSLKVDAGATLINNGGIGYTDDSSFDLSGSMINNAAIAGVSLMIDGGSLQNTATAKIDSASSIFLNAGSVSNSGALSCMIYQTGAAGTCTVSGVDASLIRPTNPIKSFADMTFTPLSLEENVSNTIGLSGDHSEFITAPDDYRIFALGFALSLTAGQNVVVQSNADYLSYMYICNPDKTSYESAGLSGMTYTAPVTGTYYLITGGFDTLFTGSLSVTVFDPAAHISAGLDFQSSDSASGTGWTWDLSSKTLTLSGITLASGEDIAIWLPEGSTIMLTAGTRNVINSNTDAIRCNGNLTITGSGTLLIDSGSSGAPSDPSELNVQGKNIGAAIFSGANLRIHDAGVINCAASGRYGILGVGDVTIENCADVTGISTAIGLAAGNSISITGSDVTAFGNYFGICTGPYVARMVYNGLESMSKSDAQVSVDKVSPIDLPQGGDITITGSTVDASCRPNSSSGAIYAGDNLSYDMPQPAEVQQHAKIVLSGSIISQPTDGYIADASFGGYKCQSITSIQGLSVISEMSQTSKSVLIEPVYTLGYNPNGGTGSIANPGPVTPSSKVVIAPNGYTYTGLTFTGWNTAADGSGTSYAPGDVIKVTKNMVLYAMWKVNTYTVRFVDWNGTELSKTTVNYGASAKAPSDPARSGYTFKGWDKTFSNVTSDLTVTAQYSAVQAATAKVVKTGETGGLETLGWALLAAAAGISTVYIALRKKARG